VQKFITGSYSKRSLKHERDTPWLDRESEFV
jgi:hypothetical protein